MDKKLITLLFFCMSLLPCCSKDSAVPELPAPTQPEEQQEEEQQKKEHTPYVLGSEWTKKTISEGMTYYSFEGVDTVSRSHQTINVLDIDLSNKRYSVKFEYSSDGAKTSDVMKSMNAVAAMNAGYEKASIVIEVNGAMYSNMPNNYIGTTTVPNWKSEAAIYSDGERDVQIEFSCKGKSLTQMRSFYFYDKRKNTISSAPMLIDNYDRVGTTFAKGSGDLTKLEYEDPDRHQGVRHPRTAVAKTENGHFLMIVVDGRVSGVSEGMNAKELTNFLASYFDPQYALNMDGGGSTTLCVAGQGDPDTHVVNYPCDNGIHDHAGERTVTTHFYILDSEKK